MSGGVVVPTCVLTRLVRISSTIGRHWLGWTLVQRLPSHPTDVDGMKWASQAAHTRSPRLARAPTTTTTTTSATRGGRCRQRQRAGGGGQQRPCRHKTSWSTRSSQRATYGRRQRASRLTQLSNFELSLSLFRFLISSYTSEHQAEKAADFLNAYGATAAFSHNHDLSMSWWNPYSPLSMPVEGEHHRATATNSSHNLFKLMAAYAPSSSNSGQRHSVECKGSGSQYVGRYQYYSRAP